MRSAVLATFALLLGPGCLEDGPGPAREGALPEGGLAGASGAQELGSQRGMALAPSVYDFTVAVPPGGATLVRWELLVENAPATGNKVTGPGCPSGGPGNVNVVVQVGLSYTVRGSCDDLSAGEHTFQVEMAGPAPAFTATVAGNVRG